MHGFVCGTSLHEMYIHFYQHHVGLAVLVQYGTLYPNSNCGYVHVLKIIYMCVYVYMNVVCIG